MVSLFFYLNSYDLFLVIVLHTTVTTRTRLFAQSTYKFIPTNI